MVTCSRPLGSSFASLLLAVALALSACSAEPPPRVAERVPVAPPRPSVHGLVAQQFWAELSPLEGRWQIYPVHPGNLIYRDEDLMVATNFTFDQTAGWATCTPGVDCPADRVRLYSDPMKVTYVTGGRCYAHGESFDLAIDPTCGGSFVHDGCSQEGVYCAPVEMTSTFSVPLHDPIFDVANSGGDPASPVMGCVADSANASGLCAQDSAAKLDPATSTFAPGIPGDGASNLPCDYCYGNLTAAATSGVPGLADVLLPGSGAALQAINTNGLALRLVSPAHLALTFTIYHASPSFDAPGGQIALSDANGAPVACLDPAVPTHAMLVGGAFGPPEACTAGGMPGACDDSVWPTTGCCAYGSPGVHQSFTYVGASGTQTPEAWSDTLVALGALNPETYGCKVSLNTQDSSLDSDDEIVRCSSTWRTFNPALIAKSTAAIGVLNGQVVIAGGRRKTAMTSMTSTVQSFALPSCANPSPSVVTNLPAMPEARWGSAATVASDGMYVIGGSNTDNTCSAAIYRLASVNAMAWEVLPSLPVVLCQASAVTLTDRTNGREYIVVVGGMDRPNPRVTALPTPIMNRTTYVYDVAAHSWASFTGTGRTLQQFRYNMGAAANSASRVAIFVGGTTNPSGAPAAQNKVSSLYLDGGTPYTAAASNLPTVASNPGVAAVGTQFVVSGGAPTVSSADVGTRNTYSIACGALNGSWTQLPQSPRNRHSGALVVSAFDESDSTDLVRLLHVAGTGGGSTFSPIATDEFNP